MKALLRTHWMSVVFAIFAGFIMVAPQLFFIHKLDNAYHGIYMLRTDAETHYLSRMKELYDGHLWGNPFLAEFKDKQHSISFILVELILAVPGYVFGVGVVNLNLIYKFLFPAVIFILGYALVWRIARDKWAGVAAGSLITLGYNIMTFAGWQHLVKWEYAYTQFALYSRPVSPEVSVLVFLECLILIYSLWQSPSWRVTGLVGLIFGFSFYVYFFLWVFLSALFGVFLLVLVRDRRFKYFLAAFLGGLAIGVPVLAFMFQASRSPLFGPLSFLLGVIHDRSWHIGFLSIAVCLFLIFLVFKKYLNRSVGLFLGLLTLTTLGVLVQNVVTNIKIQEGHFHWYFNVPIYAIIIAVGVSAWLADKPVFKKVIFGILICSSFLNGWLVQTSSYSANYEQYAKIQDAGAVFDWLNTNSPRDSVVLSNEPISELVPIYTHNNVFWNAYASLYLSPIETIEYRLFYLLNLNGYLGTQSDVVMRQDLVNLSKTKTEINGIYGGDMPAIYSSGLAQRYQNFLKNFKNIQMRYKLDYILADQRTNHWKIPTGAEVVYNKNSYTIYKIR